MPVTEPTVRLAAQLYEIRDTLRRLDEGEYHKCVAKLLAVLRSEAARKGRSVLDVAQRAATSAECAGQPSAALWCLAAAVEDAEPSTGASL